MDDKLKDCPFCGAAAVRKPDPGRLNEMFGLVVDHKPGCFLGFLFLGTDDAIDAAWNSRTPPAQAEASTLPGEVARVVAWLRSNTRMRSFSQPPTHSDLARAIELGEHMKGSGE